MPTGYYLERDPDVLILRRLDGSMVGAFSARGAAPEAVRRTIEETAHRGPSTDWETPATARSAALRAMMYAGRRTCRTLRPRPTALHKTERQRRCFFQWWGARVRCHKGDS